MGDQKGKKNLAEILAFLNVYYPKTHLIKALYSLYSFKSYERLLGNPKTGASRNLFLPESDFKISSAVNCLKKYPDFGDLETNHRQDTQLEFFVICPSTYELNTI